MLPTTDTARVAKAAHSNVPTILGARNRGVRLTARRATAAPTILSTATNQFATERVVASLAYGPTPKWSVSSNQTLIAANPAHHRATRSPTATTNRPGGVGGRGSGEMRRAWQRGRV